MKARRQSAEGLVPLLFSVVFAFAIVGCGEANPPAKSASEASAASPKQNRPPGSPNLVIITMDTTRADMLGTYGARGDGTPRLDALALEGVLFESALSSSPETLPSHASLFTGLLPFEHGVRSNEGHVLSDDNGTLAEFLARRNYRTGAEIAARVLGKETKIVQGFEYVRGPDDPGVEWKRFRLQSDPDRSVERPIRVANDITQSGIEFIRRHRAEKFFLWLHYFDAHDPYEPPLPYSTRFPKDPYRGEIAQVDDRVGEVIQEIESLGLRDQTLVIVTADHGEGRDEHNESTHSFFVYDTTIQVPLIFWGLPALPHGVRIRSMVRTIDVVPTALDLMGLPPMQSASGVSLVPLIEGRQSDLGLTGYGEATRIQIAFGLPPIRYVREGRWKYIHKKNPELYDVVADPAELDNRFADQSDVAARLRARLEALLRDAKAAPASEEVEVDSATASQLRALGYAVDSGVIEVHDDIATLETGQIDPMSKAEDIRMIPEILGHLHEEDYALAEADVEKLYARNPDNAFAMGLYAEAMSGLGEDAEAVRVLERLVQLEPDNVEKWKMLAEGREKLGRSTRAVTAWKELLEIRPCDLNALGNVDRLLRDQSRFAEIVIHFEKGVKNCPDIVANANNLAWALATLPDPGVRDGARAVEIAERLISKLDQRDPNVLDTLAAAFAEVGHFERAVKTQEESVQGAQRQKLPPAALAVLRDHLTSYRAGRPIRDPALQ